MESLKSVLIVDDEPNVCAYLKDLLDYFGYETAQALTCKEAIDHLNRYYLNRLIQQLEVGPAWLHHDPPCALWLDGHRRINVGSVDPYAAGSALMRVSVNKRPLHSLKDRAGWPERAEISPAAPHWRLEIVCHYSEVGAFTSWLAEVVSRREGYLRRLPAPPAPLLNWDDLGRLDDYLYYLSAVSLWSEKAFHEDVKWTRHTVQEAVA